MMMECEGGGGGGARKVEMLLLAPVLSLAA